MVKPQSKSWPTPKPEAWQHWLSQWIELLEAGIPAMDALALSIEIGGPYGINKKIRNTVQTALTKLQHGAPLSGAFEQSNNLLPQELCLALHCAQASGDLGIHLRKHLDRWISIHHAQKELKKSLAYPSFVLLCSVLCWCFLHASLPTKEIHTSNDHSLEWSDSLLLGGIALLFFLTPKLIKNKNKSRITNALNTSGWFPNHALHVSGFFFLIASELEAGFDLIYTLRHRTAIHMKSRLRAKKAHQQLNLLSAQIQRGIQQGKRLSEAMEQAQVPSFLLQQAQLAEQTGDLSRCFHLAAKVFELQAKQRLERLKNVLGPLTLILSAVTLITAYQSTIAPLYENLGKL